MKVRVVYREDGGVSVISPTGKTSRTYEESCEKAMLEPELEGCDFDDIDASELPKSREYRDAWTGSKGVGISLDATKKAEIDARPTEEQEALIQDEIRKIAEDSLVAKGELESVN